MSKTFDSKRSKCGCVYALEDCHGGIGGVLLDMEKGSQVPLFKKPCGSDFGSSRNMFK